MQFLRPVPLALAIAIAFNHAGYATAADKNTVVHISIAQQPLAQALNALARQTQLELIVNPADVAGKTAKAISGNLTVQQALDQLLDQTGLFAQVEGNAITVQMPSSQTLPAINVVGKSTDVTEGTGAYIARVNNTATKLNLSARETPQTVTVVTRQQMDDFGMTKVDDALESASGVFVYKQAGNGNFYYSRGFFLQSQYDGIPNPIGISNANRNPQIDSAFLDRVDIIQGAAGLTTGAGDPGGTVNLVRKRPTHEFAASAEAQIGSWNQRRFVGDISGALTESGNVRGRLVLLTDDADSFVDYVNNKRRGAYGIIEADLTASTTLSASIQYQKDRGRDHLGVVFAPDGSDLNLPRSVYFGNPNADMDKKYTNYTVGIEQQLPQNWSVKATYSRNETDATQLRDSWLWGTLDVATGDGVSLYQSKSLYRKFTADTFDAYASGPVNLFGRQHEFAFGVNGSTMNARSSGTDYFATPINIYNFDPRTLPEPPGSATSDTNERTVQYGAYGVGRFNVTDALKLIIGSRISNYEHKNLETGNVTQKETGVITPYAGIIYDINKQYSAYVSYSDIFTPQSEKDTSGGTIKPIVGKNYEIGMKGELLDGKLQTALAIFHLEQTNIAKEDTSIPYDPSNPCGGTCYTAADKVSSQGVDISATGTIATGLQIAAGYTFVDSKYASGAQKDERFMTTLPRHSARLAANYKVPHTPWTVGGSVRYFGSIYNADNMHRGAMALFRLHAGYQITSKASLALSIDNLFDKRYFATVDSLFYTPYGEPRKVTANLKYTF
jgi:outer membrane receptor for ferric coprogen and ferric-rhodotorulic acid